MSQPGDACSALLAVVAGALSEAGRPAGRSAVVVGQVAWDDCCEGYLYVGCERLYHSSTFPVEDAGWDPCHVSANAALFVVGLLRCVPTLDDGGTPPSPAALTAASLVVYDDAAVILAALRTQACDPDVTMVLAGQTYPGADGGCVAVETRLYLDLDP